MDMLGEVRRGARFYEYPIGVPMVRSLSLFSGFLILTFLAHPAYSHSPDSGESLMGSSQSTTLSSRQSCSALIDDASLPSQLSQSDPSAPRHVDDGEEPDELSKIIWWETGSLFARLLNWGALL